MTEYQNQLKQTEIPYFIELYDIITETGTIYLTPYIREVMYDNKKYIPCVMERSEFEKEQQDKITVTISFATKENISLSFLSFNVPRIRVILRRFFIEANVAKVIFVGEGDSVGVNNRVITLKLEDILSMRKTRIPPIVYSSYCNNTLFDSRCGLFSEAWRLTVQVIELEGGKILKADATKNYAQDFFTYGYVKSGENYRLITKHDNVNGYIYLHAPFDSSVDGKSVLIYAGCDKTPDTCKNKFNNFNNFLGFCYIPQKNPVIWGLI